MTLRRIPCVSRIIAGLLAIALAVVPPAMALRPLPPTPAPAPVAGGMHGHHGAPVHSHSEIAQCCDLCAVVCISTATLPAGATPPVVALVAYHTELPVVAGLPAAGRSALRLPFAQGPPLQLV